MSPQNSKESLPNHFSNNGAVPMHNTHLKEHYFSNDFGKLMNFSNFRMNEFVFSYQKCILK